MSTYYGYHCKTCGTSSECWYNRGSDILRWLWMHRRFLTDVVRLIDDNQSVSYVLSFNIDRKGCDDSPLEWFGRHLDHEIVLRNEYEQEFDL